MVEDGYKQPDFDICRRRAVFSPIEILADVLRLDLV